eukprot:Blabericola_migrator_1__5648@NODE_286_length_10380_cov_74_401920_g236_i0_p9_GENE_NODE_286_length_10380_cov_74_401920_g236_i0NODE_286_length_10380_cov_74_401920_g236_i0_p9_ORF_typecomplete_len116_score24_84_NODE_286_length_10380_cov_74_401920_g236_i015731920
MNFFGGITFDFIFEPGFPLLPKSFRIPFLTFLLDSFKLPFLTLSGALPFLSGGMDLTLTADPFLAPPCPGSDDSDSGDSDSGDSDSGDSGSGGPDSDLLFGGLMEDGFFVREGLS